MKSLLTLLLLIPFIGFSQVVHEQKIEDDIDEVKLYLTSGRMLHQESIKVKKGRNKLIFTGVSAFADPQSIQFTSSTAYRLVSVKTEMDFLAAEKFNPKIKLLKDSLEVLNDQLQLNNDEQSAYRAERDILSNNKDLGGKNQRLSVEEIAKAGEFYRVRTLKINRELSRLKKERNQHTEKLEMVRSQLVELNYVENQRSNQVIVLLDIDQSVSMDVELSYLVSDCGWAASYDLSADNLGGEVFLKYRAQVYNNTGNDWSNIRLVLSTADPKLSAVHPELKPWYVNASNVSNFTEKNEYYVPVQQKLNYRQEALSNVNLANQRVYSSYYIDGSVSDGFQFGNQQLYEDNRFRLDQEKNVANNGVQIQNVEISELSAEFEIETDFSCPSDSKPYFVDVKDLQLNASFSHITVPKLDRAAFLIANITGWQELDLMPGPTNVYFAGRYVGVSKINTRNVSDTLKLSFGRDENVLVLRKLKKEFSTKKVIGNFKKASYMYEIAVRNNHEMPIELEVYDQVPLSNTSDISIHTDELSGGQKSDETGEVKWTSSIQPGATLSKEIGYTVKYPKNVLIKTRTFRVVSCPSF